MGVGVGSGKGMSYGSNSGKKKKKSSGSGGLLSSMLGSVYDTISNVSGQRSSLAEAIEKQAAAARRRAETEAYSNQQMGADPYQLLQSQLFDAMNNVNVAPTPYDQIQSMANQQVNAQFEPMLQALAQEMASHQNRAGRSQKEARSMYGDLSKDFLSQLPAITDQYAAEDRATNARYDDAQNVLNEQYSKQAANQDAVLRRLGVQAASQGASQQAQDDQKYFQSQMELDQQQAMNAQDQEQNAALDYQRSLGSNAKMTGENVAQDIGQQLSDYLTQAEGQRNSIVAQKGSALAALIQQMQAQDQQRVQTQGQQEIDNLMKAFRFQLDATNASNDNAYKMAKMTGGSGFGGIGGSSGGAGGLSTGLAGASNYLASQYPDQPILASHLMENLNNVLSNKDVVNGKFVLDKGDPSMGKGPTYSDVGQEYMMDLLRRQFEQQGGQYSTGDINATMNALLAYLGKLR